MENEFANKVVVVTGATSGIGRAVARRFASEKANVVAVGRNAKALNEVVREIESAGGQSQLTSADVTNESDAQRIVGRAIERFGRLDVLVNAAGHISSGTVETTELLSWDAMMNVTKLSRRL